MKISTSKERINELLDSDPRSLTSIAYDLGVSKQAVSAWKNGIRSPKKSVLIKIAEIYHVNIDWLMGFDVEKSEHHEEPDDDIPKTDEAKILSKGIDRLPKEQREQALAMFRVMFAPQYAELFTKGTGE